MENQGLLYLARWWRDVALYARARKLHRPLCFHWAQYAGHNQPTLGHLRLSSSRNSPMSGSRNLQSSVTEIADFNAKVRSRKLLLNAFGFEVDDAE